MVVCYVTLQPSISQPPGKTVYALLLALDGKWDEVSVSKASVCDGYGVFPRGKAAGWDQLPVPVLMPYLGVETVAQDHTSLRLLLAVLRGEFERLTLAELAKGSGRRYVRDGLCAVALDELEARRGRPVYTKVEPPKRFHDAEWYHRQYNKKNKLRLAAAAGVFLLNNAPHGSFPGQEQLKTVLGGAVFLSLLPQLVAPFDKILAVFD